MRTFLLAFSVLAVYALKGLNAGTEHSTLYRPTFLTFPKFRFSHECAHSGLAIWLEYRRATYDFAAKLYKIVAARSQLHAAHSPMSLWLMLAALAEGAEGPARSEIFRTLALPEDKCQRQQFYKLASKYESPGHDVSFIRKRLLAYDEGLELKKIWTNDARSNCLLNTMPVPIKRDPITAKTVINNLINARLPVSDFNGNSVLVDSLDYQALWTTAFSDAVIENAPFFNDAGIQSGTVDLMRMKKRMRMTYIPGMDMKVLELPVGYNGRYRLLLGIALSTIQHALDTFRNTLLFEVLGSLRISRIPIDIAVPRFTMTSEYDMRPLLEEMGIRSIWTDSYATSNISDPAAKPSAVLQRVTISFNQESVKENAHDQHRFPSIYAHDTETGLDPILGNDFIANKPFMTALVDSETYTLVMAAIFGRPTLP